MRKHRASRPRVSDVLEDRSLPSQSGVPSPSFVLVAAIPLPSQVQDTPGVRQAFDAFLVSYEKAVTNVLLAPGPDGTVNPLANRAAFSTVVEQALTTLSGSLVASLESVSPGSPVATQVVNSILGQGPNSLESRLLNASLAALEQLGSFNLPTPESLVAAHQPFASTANPVPTQVLSVVAQSIPATTQSLVAVTYGDASVTSSTAITREVRKAFSAFLNDYFKAARDVLLTPGQAGAFDPKAHREDFDAEVDRALKLLNKRLTAALDLTPATSPLGPKVREQINGPGPSSLQGRLTALPTLSNPQADSVRAFTLGSVQVVADVLSMITGSVSQILNRPTGSR